MEAAPAELSTIQRFLAARGTSHYLPTTVTASIDDTLAALERLAAAIESRTPADEAEPVGIHLEGPFLSHAKRGVHAPDLLQPPSIELFDRFQQAARGHIKLLTIAPEGPGAAGLIRHAVAYDVRCSVGHSNATTPRRPSRPSPQEQRQRRTPSTPCAHSTIASPESSPPCSIRRISSRS